MSDHSNSIENDEKFLIDDKTTFETHKDSLNHSAIVSELLRIIRTVSTPSNIALYGSWGSGKSTIIDMLKEEIAQVPTLGYEKIEAYKYSGDSLRRNFIRTIAGDDNKTILKNLESSYSITENIFPVRRILLLITKIFISIIAGMLISISILFLIFGVESLLHLLFKFTVDTNLFSTQNIVLPAAVLAGILNFLLKPFSLEKTFPKISDEDLFIETFRELVAKKIKENNLDKVVIFVDELDRCEPPVIVSVLQTIRTFLDIEKCIFIVAIDPQILEFALSQNLEQATSTDFVNPYYSSGSAYLDKVFSYQIVIPPLFGSKVFEVAQSIFPSTLKIEGDLNKIISILIPSHIANIRRVKILINSFLINYDLANKKGLTLSADETYLLAKLICLRIEFPIFYREFISEPKLIDYLLFFQDSLLDQDELDTPLKQKNALQKEFPFISKLAIEKTIFYGATSRELDPLLVDRTHSEKRIEMVKMQSEQLKNYLSRTKQIGNIFDKKLIYLENITSSFNLDPLFGQKLEKAAEDFSDNSFISLYLMSNFEIQKASLRFLSWQAKNSSSSLLRQNISKSIFHLLNWGDLTDHDFEEISSIVEDLNKEEISQLIEKSTFRGAWLTYIELYLKYSGAKELVTSDILTRLDNLGAGIINSNIFSDHMLYFKNIAKHLDIARKIDSRSVDSALLKFLINSNFSEFEELLEQITPNAITKMLNEDRKIFYELEENGMTVFEDTFLFNIEKILSSEDGKYNDDIKNDLFAILIVLTSNIKIEALMSLIKRLKKTPFLKSISPETTAFLVEEMAIIPINNWPVFFNLIKPQDTAQIDYNTMNNIFDKFISNIYMLKKPMLLLITEEFSKWKKSFQTYKLILSENNENRVTTWKENDKERIRIWKNDENWNLFLLESISSNSRTGIPNEDISKFEKEFVISTIFYEKGLIHLSEYQDMVAAFFEKVTLIKSNVQDRKILSERVSSILPKDFFDNYNNINRIHILVDNLRKYQALEFDMKDDLIRSLKNGI